MVYITIFLIKVNFCLSVIRPFVKQSVPVFHQFPALIIQPGQSVPFSFILIPHPNESLH